MSRPQPIEKLTLTQKHAVIFADLVCGAPVKQTQAETGLSKTQVINVRNRVKRFLRKDFDHNELRKRVLGLGPLVIKNIAQFLLDGDKEVTLACAKGFGFLPKDMEELKEIFMAVNAVRAGDQSINLTISSPLLKQLACVMQEESEQTGGVNADQPRPN